MEIISGVSEIESRRAEIEPLIEKYANRAEHTYQCYMDNIEHAQKPHIFRFNDDSEGLILAYHEVKDNEWYLSPGIIALEEKKIDYLRKFLKYAFENNAKKVVVEFVPEFRRKLLKELKEYKVGRINYSLIWPVFKMDEWNGDLMQGKEWKDLRYYWNKFFRDHKVEFVGPDKVQKEDLKRLVREWKKIRTAKDRVYIDYYMSVIENGFKGYECRIMVVNDKPVAITAGLSPMKGADYSSIGLYNKAYDRIGEVSNMDDLIYLKKKGYKFVDFGGGEKALTEFKKKFKPSYYYKTYIFPIKPKDETKTDVPKEVQ